MAALEGGAIAGGGSGVELRAAVLTLPGNISGCRWWELGLEPLTVAAHDVLVRVGVGVKGKCVGCRYGSLDVAAKGRGGG